MSTLAMPQLSRDEARSLTDEAKNDGERLWRKLVELYEGQAHIALGYSSWGAYFEAEFGASKTRAYELIAAGRVIEALRNSGLELPANEAQANELAPLLGDPEAMNKAWEEAVSSSNGKPTASAVRRVVKRLSEEERAQIIALHSAGKTQTEIAAQLNRSPGAISKVLRTVGSNGNSTRLARRRQAGTAQTRLIAAIQRTCREWGDTGDEEYIPAPEIARRIRILDTAVAFLESKRAYYREREIRNGGS